MRPFAAHLPALLATAMLCAGAGPACAQFASVPSALPSSGQVSQASNDLDYRQDGARHLYASYPMRIYRGRMPPMLHGVAIVETDIDGDGKVLDVRFKRPPSAPEVAPWIVQMIRRASPFPAPARTGGATYVDVWLVHKGGNFQLDTLTEGQD